MAYITDTVTCAVMGEMYTNTQLETYICIILTPGGTYMTKHVHLMPITMDTSDHLIFLNILNIYLVHGRNETKEMEYGITITELTWIVTVSLIVLFHASGNGVCIRILDQFLNMHV
jgi:hypothetical protein